MNQICERVKNSRQRDIYESNFAKLIEGRSFLESCFNHGDDETTQILMSIALLTPSILLEESLSEEKNDGLVELWHMPREKFLLVFFWNYHFSKCFHAKKFSC